MTTLGLINMDTKNLEKTIGQIFDGSHKYIIPLYQRNFAWRQEQIELLLQDIYGAYTKGESHYFIGSLVVLKRNNGDYEVIDGQQRLTTLSLITKIMGINQEPRLFYDSRPEVEDFFIQFYKSHSGGINISSPSVYHLQNAIDYIKNAELDPNMTDDTKGTGSQWNNLEPDAQKDFAHYIANHVYQVFVEIPAETDVAAYFEIMNNRGEQLQKHEILKSLMMKSMDLSEQKEFAIIWNACSQMNIPIQKSFNSDLRKKYFGDGYDEFMFTELTKCGTASQDNGLTIDQILDSEDVQVTENNDDYDDAEDESEYKSIIDFPNFLMHIFKVMFPKEDVKLNEKFLLSTYYSLKNDLYPKEFIKKLFYSRVIFDRYVVKTIIDKKDSEDGEKWTLRKPQKYDRSWKYVDTFGNVPKEQARIVKALSMLQVSYRTRIYKNWLFNLLKWFIDRDSQEIYVTYQEFIKCLDNMIMSSFNDLNIDYTHIESFDQENYHEGTNTPHFMFNFIDYLYWVSESKTNLKHDFEFKYWNSVEHHMAREWADRNNVADKEKFIDNIGNLCLISKSANSRLSDRDVKEKVLTFGKGNLGANRQIMYEMTKTNNYNWGKDQILSHYNDLLNLLQKRWEILS